MEDRSELAETLLAGLPEDERQHVLGVIGDATEDKLRRLRAQRASQIPEQDTAKPPG
jgi:hypothetical protein